jgi:hypothetical protein
MPPPVDEVVPPPKAAPEPAAAVTDGVAEAPTPAFTELPPEPKPRSILTFEQAVDSAKMSGSNTDGTKPLMFLGEEIHWVTNPKVASIAALCESVTSDTVALRVMIELAASIPDKATVAGAAREIDSYRKPGVLITAWEGLCLELFPDEAKKAGYPSETYRQHMGHDRSEAADQLDDPAADSGAPDRT